MKKTATIIRMKRPVKNGMYTDKYTVTYESGVTRTFTIKGCMIKSHLDFMMSADVEVRRTASGKHTSDVFTPPAVINYRNCAIIGSLKARYVCVDWCGNFAPRSYATVDEVKAAVDEMYEDLEKLEQSGTVEETEPAATSETNESEVNKMNNEMYLNNEYRAEYYDTDLDIWVQIDDLTHMKADTSLEAIQAAVEYMAYSDYESGNGDDIDDLKAIWYNTPWRAAQEINPEYNADYNWEYE